MTMKFLLFLISICHCYASSINFIEECPYAVHEENTKINQLRSDVGVFARSGNEFISISNFLAMGYCCKSMLYLPEELHYIPTSMNGFKTEYNKFDFSTAELPEEFDWLYSDKRICEPDSFFRGRSAYIMQNENPLHPSLVECIGSFYLRGCEKSYLGSVIDTNDCPLNDNKGDGSLVIHIRSGDVFLKELKAHGQPPLQYYLKGIWKKNWDRVSIITHHDYVNKEEVHIKIDSHKDLNPVYSELYKMVNNGTFGDLNINMYPNRTVYEDLKDLTCANGIISSRSSFSSLAMSHSKAQNVFIPCMCGSRHSSQKTTNLPLNYRRGDLYDSEFILSEYPERNVYGIHWERGHKGYSPFEEWKNTKRQYSEMIDFSGIDYLEECKNSYINH